MSQHDADGGNHSRGSSFKKASTIEMPETAELKLRWESSRTITPAALTSNKSGALNRLKSINYKDEKLK